MRVMVFAVMLGAALAAARPAAADVQLTMADGRVTLIARNATVPQILAEWGRVGQTRIVNGERVAGAPLTIELKDVPEAQALDIVLRAVSGYVLAPRSQAAGASASTFDRIYIVPTTAATRPAPVAVAPPVQSTFQAPRFTPPPPPDDLPDEPVVRPGPPMPGVTGAPGMPTPGMPTAVPPAMPPAMPANGEQPGVRPQPQPGFMVFPTPQAAPAPSGTPAGVPVPGMVVPAPTPQNRDVRSTAPTPQ